VYVCAGVLEKLPLLKLVWGLLSSGVDGGGGVGSRGCSTRAAARPMLLPDVRPEKASGPATSAQLLTLTTHTHSILLHARSTPLSTWLAIGPGSSISISHN
jgi:hypothetical protein